ncbi:hypothetical protein P6U16_11915 [Rhizobium sp. 32-5/1]|nr:hypothetical protein [Rhizobium sp. 32-5/1]WEZ85260.1 hypothetical protein P6U16_11915 [Rhizobium sp. 32-5/1]
MEAKGIAKFGERVRAPRQIEAHLHFVEMLDGQFCSPLEIPGLHRIGDAAVTEMRLQGVKIRLVEHRYEDGACGEVA